MASTIEILTDIKILSGESLSNAVDCSAGRVVRITTPADWDNANITFQISSDGNGFSNLFRANGEEVMVICDDNRGILVKQDDWLPGLFIKIRSGTLRLPVLQTADREFAIALLVETVAP